VPLSHAGQQIRDTERSEDIDLPLPRHRQSYFSLRSLHLLPKARELKNKVRHLYIYICVCDIYVCVYVYVCIDTTVGNALKHIPVSFNVFTTSFIALSLNSYFC